MNQQQKQTTTTTKESDTPLLDQMVTFTPFMAKTPVSLSPRIITDVLAVKTRSGHKPGYAEAQKFLRLCEARGLNPYEGDAYLVGYDTKDGPKFNLITAHQAFLKRAEVHPEYDGMESGVMVRVDGKLEEHQGDFVDQDEELVGGWAKVFYKHRSHPMYRRQKLSTFSTGYSRWNADPAGMIVKVAEADALRSSFPNSLGGMYLRDELTETTDEASEPMHVPMPTATEEPHHEPVETVEDPPAEENPDADTPPAEENDDPAPVKWRNWLDSEPSLEELNDALPELAPLNPEDKTAVKQMIGEYAVKRAWHIPRGKKAFQPKG